MVAPIIAAVAKKTAMSAASKAFTQMGKIKANQWKEMGKSFKEMTEFSKQGGVARFIGGTVEVIKTKIKNQVIGMFSPVINEVTQFTADLLKTAAPLGEALGSLIGFLKDTRIGVDEFNVSLLDLALGFPLILKGFQALSMMFNTARMSSKEFVELLESLGFPITTAGPVGDPYESGGQGTRSNIPPTIGPGGATSGYQEY